MKIPSTSALITTGIIVVAVMYIVNHVDSLKNIVEG